MPERIQRKRVSDWRMPPGARYVGRPTIFGNPFRPGAELAFPYRDVFGPVVRDRAHAVEIFTEHARVTSGYALLARKELAGEDLCCWCPLPAPGEPDICHAAVLLAIANSEED